MIELWNIAKEISSGLWVTLSIFGFTLLFSIPLGLLLSVMAVSKNRILSGAVGIYTWLLRGTPLMLQIFFLYFGWPIIVMSIPALAPYRDILKLDNYSAGLVGFILNYAAYFAEIFRGGIKGIDRGQLEAARALGLNYPRTMLRIVIPQAIRNSLPPIGNETITLIKDTVLLAIISLKDILQYAKIIVSREFTLTPFLVVAVFYLVMTFVVTRVMKLLERRFSIPE